MLEGVVVVTSADILHETHRCFTHINPMAHGLTIS